MPSFIYAELLVLKDRNQAGVTAVACGLYFVRVVYPKKYGLLENALSPEFKL